MNRPYAHAVDLLRSAGLRPTRQRIALARLLFDGRDRHLTAEDVHAEAAAGGVRVSLATVYNALHQFTASGLLREVVVDPGRSYFDTNAGDHHHFYFVETGALQDIASDDVAVSSLPEPPVGTQINRVDVIVRVARRAPAVRKNA
ncbi:MAG: iron response transcriptional regulator IrrA [Alphaproteobacteria bacterium]